MNTRIQNSVTLTGLVVLSLSLANTNFSNATEKSKAQIKKQTQKPAGEAFGLTLSTIPYSTDPNSEYVRVYCAPGKKHPKNN